MDYTDILLNESHIPNNSLREDIVNEVNKYIGYAYAEDINLMTISPSTDSRSEYRILDVTMAILWKRDFLTTK